MGLDKVKEKLKEKIREVVETNETNNSRFLKDSGYNNNDKQLIKNFIYMNPEVFRSVVELMHKNNEEFFIETMGQTFCCDAKSIKILIKAEINKETLINKLTELTIECLNTIYYETESVISFLEKTNTLDLFLDLLAICWFDDIEYGLAMHDNLHSKGLFKTDPDSITFINLIENIYLNYIESLQKNNKEKFLKYILEIKTQHEINKKIAEICKRIKEYVEENFEKDKEKEYRRQASEIKDGPLMYM